MYSCARVGGQFHFLALGAIPPHDIRSYPPAVVLQRNRSSMWNDAYIFRLESIDAYG